MAGPAAIFKDLHHLRKHAKDLQAEIDRGPRILKAQQAKAAKQEDLIRESQDKIKRLKVTIHEKEVELKAKQQQIVKHKRQQNEAGSKKEYDALQHEIDMEKKGCGQLEDQILEAMEQVETLTARIPELEKAVADGKKTSFKVIDDIQTRRNEMTDRLNQVHKDVREKETTLPDAVKEQYERLVAARGEDALSSVQNRTCTACYTEITAQNYNDLRQEMFVLCKSCGRMLYLAE